MHDCSPEEMLNRRGSLENRTLAQPAARYSYSAYWLPTDDRSTPAAPAPQYRQSTEYAAHAQSSAMRGPRIYVRTYAHARVRTWRDYAHAPAVHALIHEVQQLSYIVIQYSCLHSSSPMPCTSTQSAVCWNCHEDTLWSKMCVSAGHLWFHEWWERYCLTACLPASDLYS